MAEGFEAVVALYVKMRNYTALEQQKEHRVRLLDQLAKQPAYTVTRKSIQQDIDILDRALAERLKRSNLMCHVDVFTDQRVSGWIYYKDIPETPVVLDILLDATHLASVTADASRGDVLKAGFATGKCGFSFKFPDDVTSRGAMMMSVRTATGKTIGLRKIGQS
ncbi:hypothetical protein JQ604_10415 [Bradyrhizobium jicamae]|uniref:hypothetical protein n=1 Tax=Bradyrhizobium jicamae TaxID=280332 RepID=UPI001BA88A78|nr:hypothetical protein [Bradyrhizobium jicamae]MBR0752597.1 hypothetical protein [Bradyrhizobium jicamae]